MAVGDAGEDRDHLVVAFERVNVDDAAAAGEPRHAGVADEILDAGSANTLGSFCSAIRSGLTAKNQSSSRLMSASVVAM